MASSFLKSAWSAGAALAVVLAGPATASAAVLTFYPNGTNGSGTPETTGQDLGDLDHHNYYAWRISGLPTSLDLTSASITFSNLYNWDSNPNILFMNLGDTARATNDLGTYSTDAWVVETGSGVTNGQSYQSAVTADYDSDDSTMSDRFTSSTNDLIYGSSTTNRIELTDHSFLAQGVSPTNGNITALYNLMNAVTSPDISSSYAHSLAEFGTTYAPNWSVVGGNSTTGWTYKYTFTTGQLTTLESYISNGGDFALLLDPDCHFFNNLTSIELITANGGGGAVPEPASLILLGTGLVAVGQIHRRRKKKRADQEVAS